MPTKTSMLWMFGLGLLAALVAPKVKPYIPVVKSW